MQRESQKDRAKWCSQFNLGRCLFYKHSVSHFSYANKIFVLNIQVECRTRPWLIEPSAGKFLYVRTNGIFLSKHNPALYPMFNTSIQVSSSIQRCDTKSRVILTNTEGISITACPLSDNSAHSSFVEIFSAGWHDHYNFKRPILPRGVSVELLNPDHDRYSFTWMEMAPKPPLQLVGKL